jgi:hypothetical protein
VQEEGVDEPDLVKTDGATIFTVAGDTLYAVAATGPGAPRIAGSLKLGRSGGDLLLHGQRLLVIQSASAPIGVEPVAGGGAPRLAVAPVSGPDRHHRGRRPRPGGAEGRAHAHARRPVRQRAPERRHRARRALLDAARLQRRGVRGRASGWLPRSRFASRISGAPSHADDGRVPRGAPAAGLLGPRDGLDPHHRPRQGPVGGRRRRGHDRRADRLRLGEPSLRGDAALDRPADGAGDLPTSTTLIHRFDVSDPDRTTYEASGEVPGYLLNQYSLSEQGGDLRVASTADPVWWQGRQQGSSQSHVTVLRRDGATLAPSGASPAWARGSGSTRCASSATSATS